MALADVIRNSNIAHVQLQLLLWIQKWVCLLILFIMFAAGFHVFLLPPETPVAT